MLVQGVIDELTDFPGGCSLEDFESRLARIGNIHVPVQHFKDFEFFWKIDCESSDSNFFIIAASFVPIDGYHLTHATVNVVEQPEGTWRTIWLADYPLSTPDAVPARIRGQQTGG
ncbi:hypothetical protein [Rhodopirellula halodulae]|uniref:hypothetical protein n=1 Tax=Rhodopirellula halodulae TaxID=2894198 RepID=UPI001E4FF575|nr:hypothetical protein [Rhodopirellula sp. JC737]MCC9656751.1 hypothetical protein [Rhodopirellula sp. JC737]